MMRSLGFEFPAEQARALRRARRLEWITIVYLVSVSGVMFLVLGSSQAMKTAWIDGLLALVPPIVFLIATRISNWPPDRWFPYGYHRVISIAFLCASLALFSTGVWLLVSATIKLVTREHPTIGGVELFDNIIWLGWLMLPVLVLSAVPAMFLGRAKIGLAETLHDKVLFADADMNKADWMSASAAFVGVIGVGFGYWWTDAVAAAVISASILRDGYTNLREVTTNLMDEVPKTVNGNEVDPLPDQIRDYLKALPWIKDAHVRMREQGHVYFGEALIVVSNTNNLVVNLDRARHECLLLDWRVYDLILSPVPSLEPRPL